MIVPSTTRDSVEQIERPSLMQVVLRRKLSIAIPTILFGAGAWFVAAALPPRYSATAVLALDARKVQFIEIDSVVSRLPDENVALRTELDAIASRSMAELVANDLNLWDDPNVRRAMYSPASASQIVRSHAGDFVRQVDALVAPYRPAKFSSPWSAGASATAIVPDVAEPQSAAAAPSADDVSAEEEAAKRTYAEKAAVIDWMLGNLDVSNDGRSLTIYLSFTSVDPQLSSSISNSYADMYLRDQVNLKVRTTQKASGWLESRLVELRDDLERSEAAISRFRRSAGLLEVKGETIAGQQLTDMSTQLSAAKADRTRLEAAASAARDVLRGTASGGESARALDSPAAAAIRTNLSAVDAQLAELVGRGSIRLPKTIALQAQHDSLTRQLAAENQRIVRSLESDAQAARAREAQLASNFHSLETRLGQGGQEAVQLNQLIREAEANRDIYESFLSRYKETIEQEGLATADARILSRAEPPFFPSGPSPFPMLLMGLVSGLGLGSLFAALRERLDHRLYRVADIETISSIPVVGILPALPRWRSPETHVLGRRQTVFGEALQRTHTTFTLSQGFGTPKVIAVTSAIPGDGKTSFSAAWARYLALSGMRVLLVDADFHRPKLAKLLRLGVEPGTADVLRGTMSLEEAVARDTRSGLDVLGAKSDAKSASLLMHQAQFKRLIAEARSRYDFVIIDTPPATAVPDAASVAACADAVLFLVRWRRTPRKALLAALRFLGICGVRVEGIVLTHAQLGRGSYWKSEYYATRIRPKLLPGRETAAPLREGTA